MSNFEYKAKFRVYFKIVKSLRHTGYSQNHYYPYGLKIATLSAKKLEDVYEGVVKNNYLYQGAFAQLDEDIQWTDFPLRNYDAQIGRWVQQDPYQEYASPYIGCGTDPVNLIDPSGGFTLAGLSKAGTAAILTLGGAIIGTAVGLISGDDDFTGTLIGAGAGLGAGLANLSARIAMSMGIKSVNVAVQNLEARIDTRPSGQFDHIWTSEGSKMQQFTVRQNGTNSIYLKIGGKEQLISDVDLAKKISRTTVANILVYYANQAGVSTYTYGGVGTFGLNESLKESAEIVPAWTEGQNVYVNKKDSKISSTFNNIFSAQSIFDHEKQHQKDNITADIVVNCFNHAMVYLKQIKDKNFTKSPPKFQLSIIASFASYLLQAENDGYEVKKLIEDFNDSNGKSYKINLYYDKFQNAKVDIFNNGKRQAEIPFQKKSDCCECFF